MRITLITPINVLVFAEQCLHGEKDFSASHTVLTEGFTKLRVHKTLHGDGMRTANPNWPKKCPILHGITLNNRTRLGGITLLRD